MKTKLLGIVILFAAVGAHAQKVNCSIPQEQVEAKAYIDAWTQSNGKVRFIQTCLKEQLAQKVIDKNVKLNAEVERFLVWDIYSEASNELKRIEQAAQIKCETTNTPGCAGLNDDGIFSDEDIQALDSAADVKRANPLEGKDW